MGIFTSSNGTNRTWSLTRQDGVNVGDLSITAYSGVGISGGYTNSSATSGYDLYVKSGGDVGIGTTAPSSQFNVHKDALTPAIIELSNNADSGNNGVIVAQIKANTVNEELTRIETQNSSNSHDNGNLLFYNRNGYTNTFSESMRITGEGYVGIGKTPDSQNILDIQKDSTAGTFVTHRNDTGFFVNRTYADYGNDGNIVEYQERIGVDGNSGSLGMFTNHNFNIRTNNIERISILSGGKVGIGTPSPDAALQIGSVPLSNNVAVSIGEGWVSNDLYHKAGGLLLISGTGASQTDAGISFQTRNNANSNYQHSAIIQDRNGDMYFYTGGAGTTASTRKIGIGNSGNITFDSYSGTQLIGTPTYVLGTDATGNVVKVLGGSIPGAGTVTSIETTNGITGGPITTSGTIQLDTTVVRTTGAQSIAGEKSFSNQLSVSNTTTNKIRLYTETNTAPIGDTFTGNTSKSYMYFDAGVSSNDPGYIMHETSAVETNTGVLHLVPSDDNQAGDHISIHGTNDVDVLKLHTTGVIETVNLQLVLKSGSGDVKVDDSLYVASNATLQGNATIGGDLSVNGGDLSLNGSYPRFNMYSSDVGEDDWSIINNNGSLGFYNVTDAAYAVSISQTNNNVAIAAKATSSATIASDGVTTLTTKSYVDGLVTGVPVYKGTWAAGTTGVTSAAISGTNITLTAAPTNTIAVGDIVTATGITGLTTLVTAVTSQTNITVGTSVTIATGITVTFSPVGGFPDLTAAALKILGNYYIVDTAGYATPNGASVEPDAWNVGDWAIFSDITPGAGTDLWQKIDNTSVISGAGTGDKMTKWAGASGANSETLTDSIISDNGTDIDILSAAVLGQNPKLKIWGYNNGAASSNYGYIYTGTDGNFNVTTGSTYLNLTANNYIKSNNVHIMSQDIFMYRDRHIRFLDGPGDSWNDVLGLTASTDIIQIGAIASFNSNVGEVAFYAANDEKMRLDVSGNLGIGNEEPLDRLDVTGVVNSSNNIVSQSTYTVFSGRSNRASNDYGGLDKQYLKLNLVTPGASTTGEGSAHGVADLRFKLANNAGNTDMVDIMTLRHNGNVGIGVVVPGSKLDVAGGIKMANDSTTASVSNVGTQRYRVSGDNSYVDMCMQTGAATYAWINIVQNNW
jgi:hypothetical protein